MKNETTQKLSEILSELIESKKDSDYTLSEKKQASLMDIPYQTFHKYVTGTAECPIGNLVKIAKYYNVTTDYLLGLTDVESVNINFRIASETTGVSELSIMNISALSMKLSELEKKIFDFFISSLNCDIFETLKEYIMNKQKEKLINIAFVWVFIKNSGETVSEKTIIELGERIFDASLNVFNNKEKTYRLTDNYYKFKEEVLKNNNIQKVLSKDINYLKFKLTQELIDTTLLKVECLCRNSFPYIYQGIPSSILPENIHSLSEYINYIKNIEKLFMKIKEDSENAHNNSQKE